MCPKKSSDLDKSLSQLWGPFPGSLQWLLHWPDVASFLHEVSSIHGWQGNSQMDWELGQMLWYVERKSRINNISLRNMTFLS